MEIQSPEQAGSEAGSEAGREWGRKCTGMYTNCVACQETRPPSQNMPSDTYKCTCISDEVILVKYTHRTSNGRVPHEPHMPQQLVLE